MIATPTTLIAPLRTVAYGWQQDALADNAQAVFELGRELYDRLGRLGDFVDKLGRSIDARRRLQQGRRIARDAACWSPHASCPT